MHQCLVFTIITVEFSILHNKLTSKFPNTSSTSAGHRNAAESPQREEMPRVPETGCLRMPMSLRVIPADRYLYLSGTPTCRLREVCDLSPANKTDPLCLPCVWVCVCGTSQEKDTRMEGSIT